MLSTLSTRTRVAAVRLTAALIITTSLLIPPTTYAQSQDSGGPPAPPACDALDAVIVFDASPSMDRAITNVKTNATALLAEIEEKSSSDYRLALIGIGGPEVFVDFADQNFQQINTGLDNLTGSGTENPFTAVATISNGSLNGLSDFRSNVRREILLITDPEAITTDQTQVGTVIAAANTNNIRVSVVLVITNVNSNPQNNDRANELAVQLARDTNGRLASIPENGQRTFTSIIEAIECTPPPPICDTEGLQLDLGCIIEKQGIDPQLVSIGGILGKATPILFTIAGLILLINLVLSGFAYLTSAGDPKKTEAAKGRVTASLIGFIIVIAAFWILQIVGFIFGLETVQELFN